MNKKDDMRVGLLNPQGHVRWENLQIASHPDTGGQTVYIIELARELGKLGVKVDIFTRYFNDPDWPGYDKEIEEYSDNLRIIRIKCGPGDKFVRKEELWPFMKDYSAGIKDFYEKEGVSADIFSSHYADGGLSGAMMKESMGIPYTHTGHSLGGEKMDKLNLSRSNYEMINKNFKFHLRISAERVAFRNAAAIMASTTEEVTKQYGHHVYEDAVKDTAKFNIIPPGIGPKQFFSYHKEEKEKETYEKAVKKIKGQIEKYIDEDRRELPCIFSAARFDAKKNPTGLLRAYASSEELQKNTNVLIVAGNVDEPLNPENRDKFKEHEKFIIEDLAGIMKNWNLEGKVCFSPGLDYVNEMPYVYRYAGRSKWIFVNPALQEPFGLTIIEAMASGLPVAATQNGGPSEILKGGQYGVLVEPTLPHSLKKGLEKLLIAGQWKKFSNAGMERVKEKFTWDIAAAEYKELFEKLIKKGIDISDDFKIPKYFMNPKEGNDSKLRKELRHLYFKV
ncbi:MAG: glycosyltransferase [Elusimicrobiota bacterium]|nr:glycosyltransferase [Elusimicrobiota bacterium]